MSHHNAAMLLAPAKPKPAVQSFHVLGLHHHFTGGQAAGLTLVLLLIAAVVIALTVTALRS